MTKLLRFVHSKWLPIRNDLGITPKAPLDPLGPPWVPWAPWRRVGVANLSIKTLER